MLHVFPHWNWKAGDTVDVWVYTNADEVELFLNGVSQGVRRKEGDVRHLVWRVPFTPGVVRAVARTSAEVVLTSEIRTAGRATRVVLTPDRTMIDADGRDLSFVTVTVVDETGISVPDAEPVVHFRVEGDATIAGVDNGDEIDHERFQRDSVRLFEGRALVIVRSSLHAGRATLRAVSAGLQPASVRITLQSPR
jgi:beta-galactosidase